MTLFETEMKVLCDGRCAQLAGTGPFKNCVRYSCPVSFSVTLAGQLAYYRKKRNGSIGRSNTSSQTTLVKSPFLAQFMSKLLEIMKAALFCWEGRQCMHVEQHIEV